MKKLEINSKDLELNIEKLKQRANNTKIIAVVKGNGYGLDLEKFSTFLFKRGINDFAVSSVEEAIELSKIMPRANILCMEATNVEADLISLIDNNVIIAVENYYTAQMINDIAKRKNIKINIQLKIDTGFSRYGFDFNDKETILKTVKDNPALFVSGVFSHFSCAYLESVEYTKLQFERFLEVKDYLEKNNVKIENYHISNSSAFLKYQSMYLNAVRLGSAFLGRVSVPNTLGLNRIGLLKSNVVSIKNIKKGTPIGYSNSEIAKKDTTLAIIPVGYSDGFNVNKQNDTFKFVDKLRILKNAIFDVFKDNRIYVLINDTKYPVIGKVGMNHITVDVTGGNVKIDDEVKIDISPILVNSRIRREYV